MLTAYIYCLPEGGRWSYINNYIVAVEGNIQTETEINTRYGKDSMFVSEHIDFRDNYSFCKNYGQIAVFQKIKKDIISRFEGEEIHFVFEPCFYMVVTCYGRKAPHMFLGTMHK